MWLYDLCPYIGYVTSLCLICCICGIICMMWHVGLWCVVYSMCDRWYVYCVCCGIYLYGILGIVYMWSIYGFMGFVFCCMDIMLGIYVLLHGVWECCLYGVCIEHLPVVCHVYVLYICVAA